MPTLDSLRQPNPQGKAALPVLQHLDSVAPRLCSEKSPQQVLDDYFISSLIISAEFRFKPTLTATYYLYYDGERWSLSLISPTEWGRNNKLRQYAGCCRLRPDMTWQCEAAADLAIKTDIGLALARFQESFRQHIQAHDTLEGSLPFYVAQLPYYQRLLATGLAASLRLSTQLHAALTDGAAAPPAQPRIAITPHRTVDGAQS